ncbi:hypothetical protein [Rhizobium rhizogenes]|uniref:hypothetical protein n=1 Tax=Rhizobium rhizogenes TaxID=359 RepID=UPI0024BE12B5|nr:hypothetical protein [Rhizobium rhizogenes]MDJ1638194.1 hypothetical protein [Rhizobium rhizogenes]
MLPLSSEDECQIDEGDLKQKIELADGALELYLGKTADMLSTSGFLNIVFREGSGSLSGCSKELLKSTRINVENQECLEQPNTSAVMNMRLAGSEIYASHWDGFLSKFDSRNMELLSQTFTK